MHPDISINTLGLGTGSLAGHADQVARIGARAIGPTLEEVVDCGIGAARRLLGDAGLAVATLTHRAFAFASPAEAAAGRARLDGTIDIAAAIGARTITMTTGGRGALDWPEAAERFSAAIAPCAARAHAASVRLSLEPTSPLYADVSIAHRLADTAALARMAGIHVGIDLFACWTDADIVAAIAAAAPGTALVQVSDYVFGDRGLPCRAVPGDGAIPLGGLIRAIVAGGFTGFFDIEVIGPRLEAEGAVTGLRRAAAAVTAMLAAAYADAPAPNAPEPLQS